MYKRPQWQLCLAGGLVVAALGSSCATPPVHRRVGELIAVDGAFEIRVRTPSAQQAGCEFPINLYVGRSQMKQGAATHQIRLNTTASIVLGGEEGLYNREVYRAEVAPEPQGPWSVFRLPLQAFPAPPFSIWSGTECEVQLSAPLPPSRGNEVPRIYPFIQVEPS